MIKRIATIQLLTSGAGMAIFTYVSIYSRELGLSNFQITVMATLYATVEFLCVYLFGRFADLRGKRRLVIMGLGALFLLTSLLSFAYDVTSLILLRVLTGIGFGMFPAALAGYAFEARLRMGRYASSASLGWGLFVLVSGPIALLWIKGVFIFSALLALAAFIVSITLPRIREHRVHTPLLPVRMVLKNRKVLFPFILRHSSAAAIWVLWPLFMKEKVGMGMIEIAIAQALNALTQFYSMFLIGDRLRPRTSMIIGLVCTSLAAASFLLVQTYPWFLLTQVLLGFSWANLYVGALRLMMKENTERSTASGLLSGVIGMSSLFGPLISIVLVRAFPSQPFEAPMYLTVILSLVALSMFFILDGGRGARQQSS